MDTTTRPDTDRCTACGARLAPEATWCSLCFAVQDAGADVPTDGADGADGALGADGDAAQVDPAQVHPAEVDTAQVEAIADRMLGELAATRPAPSRLGALSPSRLDPPVRALLMVVGVVVCSGILLGLLTLVGSLM